MDAFTRFYEEVAGMPQRDGPRLEGRDGVVWREYLAGRSQAVIAEDFGISQQRVSQIIAKVRSTVDDRDRSAYAVLDMERLTWLMNAQMPAAMKGDVGASRVVLAALARRAKMLGLDAAEPLRVTLEQDLDGAGRLVSEVLGTALEALEAAGVGGERERELKAYALALAQWKLLQIGEGDPGPRPEPPGAPATPAVEEPEDTGQAKREAEFRRMMAADGVDADELLAEEDDDDDE